MKLPAIPDQVPLPAQGGIERRVHLFDADSRNAILAAIGAARPLLVRGEPGVGKTQLAEAAAVALQRRLLTTVVDSRTEPRDLLYSFDAVARLAEAQLCGAAPKSSETDLHAARELLTPKRFLTPGPLWWAFDWKSARDQAKLSGAPQPHSDEEWEAASGTVLLIDEIDKAETDVPNGLLEALGSRQFTPPFDHQPVAQAGECPLVVITTNEERALPDPFLRRCVVLDLKPPGGFDEKGVNEPLRQWLISRGEAHFPASMTSDKVWKLAAELLLQDRFEAEKRQWTPKPGQAEYLDLVRAVVQLDPGAENTARQLKRLEEIRSYVLRKHRVETP